MNRAPAPAELAAAAPAAGLPGSDAILDRLLSLHPKIIDLTLDRVWALLSRLDHPERRLPPVVHIAGTNGKGSVTAMLRAGLEGAGGRVHAYTSPHLVRFHERIRLAGELIDEPALAALLEECETANGGAPITFFEITTVAALLAFARAPADFTLLEVGLGGRLDATNVVDRPALTVITPVSFDHQQYLGETLPEIAFEKAGILKPGVPCIVAPQAPEALAVIQERAAKIGAPLKVAGRDWQMRESTEGLIYEDHQGRLPLPRPVLPGAHQVENAGTAVAALRTLGRGAPTAALSRAEWPARLQRLRRGPLVDMLPDGVTLWLDGGHNPAAGSAVAAHFGPLVAKGARLHLVAGMLDTKAAEDYAAPLSTLVKAARTVPIPGAAASLPAATLAERFTAAGLDAQPASEIGEALSEILPALRTGDHVLLCGSLYLAGHVLAENA
ncbi:MAG: folylpolyglutamate synthase/dihydrofolate synthase family protein [Pseudomonadota bacterium]